MKHLFTVLLMTLLASGCARMYPLCPHKAATTCTTIGPFQAADAALHQTWIQECLDSVADRPAVFRFMPGDYVLSDAAGVRIPGNCTLMLNDARFRFGEDIHTDGQAFLLDNVSTVSLCGGEILGARDAWDPGVNVAGIRVIGNASDIHISGLVCRDLSSNAVGMFGDSPEAPIRNVSLVGVTGINCCNIYVDYLQDNKGPIPGSDRRDQGTVALYHVDGWSVEGCCFEGSRSDGTHFYKSHNGRFNTNTVSGSTMGGYFLEGCEHVSACGNYMVNNGSRGVTIERDSRHCTLAGCIVKHSGREGLWMPDVASICITGNCFIENGRKDDGERDCEIRLDNGDVYETTTTDIFIQGNTFHSSAHQTAVLYIAPGITGVVETNNRFQGKASRYNTVPNLDNT